MKTKFNKKKAVIWGTVVYLIDSVVSNFLWQNSIVAGIYKKYSGHSTMKPMEVFGGTGNWVMMNMIFGVFLIGFFIFLYLMIYQSLPGKSDWKKGLIFGIILGIIKAIPEAFNQFMLLKYPTILIIIQLTNTLLGLVIFGVILGIIYGKFNVIKKED